MKALKNRWFLLILGLLVGAIVGGDLAFRYAISKSIEYDKTLEDDYVDSRILSIITSTSTLAKAEQVKIDEIFSDHKVILRSAFLTLVELHKTGHYKRKDEVIRKYLRRAKEFMSERPDQFLNQQFVAMTSIVDRANDSETTADPESTKASNQARKQLQDAFDYVDGFAQPPDGTNSEVSGGNG